MKSVELVISVRQTVLYRVIPSVLGYLDCDLSVIIAPLYVSIISEVSQDVGCEGWRCRMMLKVVAENQQAVLS